MPASKSKGTDTKLVRSPWEQPAFTELKINKVTRSNRNDGRISPSIPAPLPPIAPATKFGFSLEWTFPVGTRSGK